MLRHIDIEPKLTGKQIDALKSHYSDVLAHLDRRQPLSLKVLEGLKKELETVVDTNTQWQEALDRHKQSGDHHCLHVLHQDNDIRNLPWSMVLGEFDHLYLARGLPRKAKREETPEATLAPPLKILIMTASPQSQDRLDYEHEELEILKAFEPLLSSGLVEVDFTEDGSLDTLKEKLRYNKYHILHLTGHAQYDEPSRTGKLALEKQWSMETHLVTDKDFAAAVNINPDYRVPMVMVSSCQSAQGSSQTGEKGLGGVTNHLLRAGVPAVVSMGMSISDYYASFFAAAFYRRMAKKETLFEAFHHAVEALKQEEIKGLARANARLRTPLQWLIPNLYLDGKPGRIVNWEKAPEKLELRAQRYLFHQDRLLLSHERNYLFIGRRKEKAEILRPFMEKTPILIKGQGGVGKTAMAEHLVQRLIAKDSKTTPLVFDETTKTIRDILDRMLDILKLEENYHAALKADRFDKAMDKLGFLLSEIAKTGPVVFVFDNLEVFQTGPGEGFKEEYAGLFEVMDFLCRQRRHHVILTGRHPVPGLHDVRELDLNQVGFTDFLKRCMLMDVGHIQTLLLEQEAERKKTGDPGKPPITFIDVAGLLRKTFGGNYRALEFFNELVRKEPGKLKTSLASLETFVEETEKEREAVKHRMGQNLLFSQLTALLEPVHRGILVLLSPFRVPVQLLALQLQVSQSADNHMDAAALTALLVHLQDLTLIEISIHRQSEDEQSVYYYVTPIVKDLLKADSPTPPSTLPFSHRLAGNYFYHLVENMDGEVNDYEEGFYHFDEAGDLEKVNEIGDRLSRFYDKISMYHMAFYYAHRVVERVGENTGPVVLNLLGTLHHLFGNYEPALHYLKKAAAGYKKENHKKGEGATLNNMAGIAHAKGDYERALQFLEKNLKIRQDIGDKAGEGTTLNNISQIYKARGDYERALQFLEKSLKIRQDIGDQSGLYTTLHNMAIIAYQNEDIEKFLEYETEAYRIATQINDAMGIYRVGKNFGFVLAQVGQKEQGLAMLRRSLEIGRKTGFPDVGVVEEAIKKIEGKRKD
jgi:tetratricopeptide (TPR) repeat protein